MGVRKCHFFQILDQGGTVAKYQGLFAWNANITGLQPAIQQQNLQFHARCLCKHLIHRNGPGIIPNLVGPISLKSN